MRGFGAVVVSGTATGQTITNDWNSMRETPANIRQSYLSVTQHIHRCVEGAQSVSLEQGLPCLLEPWLCVRRNGGYNLDVFYCLIMALSCAVCRYGRGSSGST